MLNEIPSSTGEGTGQEYVEGSWPLREEFSFELTNKAEYPIMFMHFTEKENRESMTAKIRVLQCYVKRLQIRHERKRFLFQYSMHRPDRRPDDVSLRADEIELRKEGISLSSSEIMQNYHESDEIAKFELDNPQLLRSFPARMQFREFAFNILEEKALREGIFRLQIARLLGFKEMSRLTEAVNFLKNPQTIEVDRSKFPPGVVLFDESDTQKYTLDNVTVKNEFQQELIEEEPGTVIVSTSQNGKLNISELESMCDKMLEKAGIPFNNQSDNENGQSGVLGNTGLEPLGHEEAPLECEGGATIPAQYKSMFPQIPNKVLLEEPEQQARDSGHNCEEYPLRALTVNQKIKLLMMENFRMPANEVSSYNFSHCCEVLEKLKLATFADFKLCNIEQILQIVDELRVVESKNDCKFCNDCRGENYSCGKRCFTRYLDYLTKLKELMPQNEAYVLKYFDYRQLEYNLQLTSYNGCQPIRRNENFESLENAPEELIQKLYNEEESSDSGISKLTDNHEYVAEPENNVQYTMLELFFDYQQIPRYQPIIDSHEIIAQISNGKGINYYDSEYQFSYLNRIFDLILHLSSYLETPQMMQLAIERSSSLGYNVVAQIINSFYFLLANASLTYSLYSYVDRPKKSVSYSNISLSEKFILFGVLQSFSGQTYLTKCEDTSKLCSFLTEFPHLLSASLQLDENISPTEQLIEQSLGNETTLINCFCKQLDEPELQQELSNMQEKLLLQQYNEVFLRRLEAGGCVTRQFIDLHIPDDSLNQTPCEVSMSSPTQKGEVKNSLQLRPVTAAAELYQTFQLTNSSVFTLLARGLLLEAFYSSGAKSPLLTNNLVNELNRHKVTLHECELTNNCLKGIRQRLFDSSRVTCESTEFIKPQSNLLVGNIIYNNYYLAKLMSFEEYAAMVDLPYLSEDNSLLCKKSQNSIKNSSKYPTENLPDILLDPVEIAKMSREEYIECRIRLFQDCKALIFTFLKEEKLQLILEILQAVIEATELELNSLEMKETAVVRVLNDAFPADQVNANAAAIDRLLQQIFFVMRKRDVAPTMQTLSIRRSQTYILEYLQQNNENPEDYVVVQPIDFLFGPKTPHNGLDDEIALLPTIQNAKKLKMSKVQRSKSEQEIQAEYIEKYLTRGELALCCISRLSISQYLEAKVSFVSNGYIVTNQVLSELDWRVGIAEAMQYLCLAENCQNDKSTLPILTDTDNCFSAYEWSACTPDRVFMFNEIQSESSTFRTVKTNISFAFEGSTLCKYNQLKVVNSKFMFRVQNLIQTPPCVLVKSNECETAETAEKLSEKLNLIVEKSCIYEEFSDAMKGFETVETIREVIRRLPEDCSETTRSWWRDNRDSFKGDFKELRKVRRVLSEEKIVSPIVISTSTPAQRLIYRSYGTFDQELQACFTGFTSVPQFGIQEFEKLCPYLLQHMKDIMDKK